jgi:aryl-alcohol dehydrogenase-like predicted oxidoreductase
MEQMSPLSRRRLLRAFAATGAAALFRPQLASSQQARVLSKPIPSTGEELPAVGLGSWITFNVGNDTIARDACAQVMRAFFDSGGRLIDSSPMYGSSQKVIGYGLTKLNRPPSLFSADKVWISSGVRGRTRSKPPADSGACLASICCRSTISSPGRSICGRCLP